jgi:hypothetical protein
VGEGGDMRGKLFLACVENARRRLHWAICQVWHITFFDPSGSMEMRCDKIKGLDAKGWKVGRVKGFLNPYSILYIFMN